MAAAAEEPSAEDVAYELVMPFVCCTSEGGPYDDEAFVAGWECARIDSALARRPALYDATVREALLAQLDLIAMRRGYTLDAEAYDADSDWRFARFGMIAGADRPLL